MTRPLRPPFPTRALSVLTKREGKGYSGALPGCPASHVSLTPPLPRPPPVLRTTLRAPGAERNLTAPVTNQKRGRGSELIGAGEGGRPPASSRPREGERRMSRARPCASASVRSPPRCEKRSRAASEAAAAAAVAELVGAAAGTTPTSLSLPSFALWPSRRRPSSRRRAPAHVRSILPC